MKKDIKKGLTNALEIPREVLSNVSVITIVGKNEVEIENYKSILEFGETRVVINAEKNVIEILGEKLTLKCVTNENVSVFGDVSSVSLKDK